jgi:hypothetical protein
MREISASGPDLSLSLRIAKERRHPAPFRPLIAGLTAPIPGSV